MSTWQSNLSRLLTNEGERRFRPFSVMALSQLALDSKKGVCLWLPVRGEVAADPAPCKNISCFFFVGLGDDEVFSHDLICDKAVLMPPLLILETTRTMDNVLYVLNRRFISKG